MAKDKEDDDIEAGEGKETPQESKSKSKDEDQEEFVIVTEDAKNLEVGADGNEEREPEEVSAKKTKKRKDDDEDEDEDEDDDEEEARLGASEEDDEEEERKKLSKGKSRRQRRREAEMRLRSERDDLIRLNGDLRNQIAQLSQRMDAGDKANLENRIKQTKSLIAQAEQVMADAANAKDKGAELVKAQTIRDNLKDDLRKLEDAKEKSDQPVRQPPDARILAHASAWRERNSWFDDGLRDLDSKIVRAIDDTLYEEGRLHPSSKAYWQELDRRIAERLPHLKKGRKAQDEDEDEDEDDEEDERPRKKKRKQRASARDDADDEDEEERKPAKRKNGAGGPRFRTGGPGRELKDNEVYLSRERIQALKDSGDWDDPVRRNKMLKKYRDYDRQQRQNQE